jgi:hypothetical protein
MFQELKNLMQQGQRELLVESLMGRNRNDHREVLSYLEF